MKMYEELEYVNTPHHRKGGSLVCTRRYDHTDKCSNTSTLRTLYRPERDV